MGEALDINPAIKQNGTVRESRTLTGCNLGYGLLESEHRTKIYKEGIFFLWECVVT